MAPMIQNRPRHGPELDGGGKWHSDIERSAEASSDCVAGDAALRFRVLGFDVGRQPGRHAAA